MAVAALSSSPAICTMSSARDAAASSPSRRGHAPSPSPCPRRSSGPPPTSHCECTVSRYVDTVADA
eukprot:364006-Prymnesium_polylepis.1